MAAGQRYIVGCCVLLICMGLCHKAHAQSSYYVEEQHTTFKGGLILGANFTQVDGDSYYGYHKIGLNTGGIVYIHFTSLFGVSMELLYTQKGSRAATVTQSQALGTYVQKYDMTLNYVEVPLMLHLKTKTIDFEAGASYAYLIKSSEWAELDVPFVVNPVTNAFRKTDFNYVLGGTMKVYKNLYLNGRFQYSINTIRDVDKIPLGFSYGTAGQFNNMVALRAIYMF